MLTTSSESALRTCFSFGTTENLAVVALTIAMSTACSKRHTAVKLQAVPCLCGGALIQRDRCRPLVLDPVSGSRAAAKVQQCYCWVRLSL